MTTFWKTAAGILIAAIMCLALPQNRKDMSILLTVAVCAMVGMVMLSFLEPVLDFLWELEEIGGLYHNSLEILLKGLGIGLVTEVIAMICTDAGNGSLAKAAQMLGSSVMVYLSIPVFRSVIHLLQTILGEI